MVVYGYARVSTDDQNNSFEQQQKRIKEYYDYHESQDKFGDDSFGGVFADEDVSGSVIMFDRPAGGELHLRLADGDHIVCTALDRCFRGVVDALMTQQSLMERDIYLHVISVGIDFSTPWGKLMYATLASYAEFERDMIRMRTKEGMEKKRSSNLPLNQHAPVGYKKVGEKADSRFEPDYKERGIAVQIVEWKEIGQLTWSQVVRVLRFKKRSSTGGDWSQRNVRRAYYAAKNNFPLLTSPDPFTLEARVEQHHLSMNEDSHD